MGNLGNLAILEKMTFFTQKILFFKIGSCLSLVDRFCIELSDTIFKIRKKIKNESTLVIAYWVDIVRIYNINYQNLNLDLNSTRNVSFSGNIGEVASTQKFQKKHKILIFLLNKTMLSYSTRLVTLIRT